MLCREIIAVRCEIHTKHITTVCVGRKQNLEMLHLVVYKVHTELQMVNHSVIIWNTVSDSILS
jgi:hypothetical protein